MDRVTFAILFTAFICLLCGFAGGVAFSDMRHHRH
jgi:hypothetical protein